VLRERRLTLDFSGPPPSIAEAGVRVLSRSDDRLVLAFDPALTSAPDLIAKMSREHAVLDVHVERPAIEEVIARFYDLHGASEA
jgi:ABC-2 type transport system ATP-binding protein